MNTSDKVVCVDDTPVPTFHDAPLYSYRFPNGMIKKGEVYCVERVIELRCTGLILVGKPILQNVRNQGWVEVGWNSKRFRLLNNSHCREAHNADAECVRETPMPSVVPRVLRHWETPGVNASVGMMLVAGNAHAVRNCRMTPLRHRSLLTTLVPPSGVDLVCLNRIAPTALPCVGWQVPQFFDACGRWDRIRPVTPQPLDGNAVTPGAGATFPLPFRRRSPHSGAALSSGRGSLLTYE